MFAERTRRKKRIAIAKDVIKSLRYLNIIRGSYLYDTTNILGINYDDSRLRENAQKFLPKLRKCGVCALGACMISHVKLFNKLTLGEIKDKRPYETNGGLTDYFDLSQMSLIEDYFEGFSTGLDFKIYHPDHKKRLKLIMENIVKNNGTFVPSQLE